MCSISIGAIEQIGYLRILLKYVLSVSVGVTFWPIISSREIGLKICAFRGCLSKGTKPYSRKGKAQRKSHETSERLG